MLVLFPVLGKNVGMIMTCNRCEWQFCSAHYQISRTLRSSSEKPLKFLNLIWRLLVSALWFKQEFIGDKIKIQWIVLGSWTSFLLIALFQLHRPVCLEFAACKSVKSAHSVWVQSPAQDFLLRQAYSQTIGRPFLWALVPCIIIMYVKGVC